MNDPGNVDPAEEFEEDARADECIEHGCDVGSCLAGCLCGNCADDRDTLGFGEAQ